MCAIGGILHFSDRPAEKEKLQAMAQAMAHRGPDGEGFYVDRNFGLLHRRLAILGTGEGAQQPLRDSATGCVLSFNGEVYNFQELAREYSFSSRSGSDSEILLQGLVRFGFSFLDKIDGDFAFSLWDPRSRTLTLGRDRFGVKPLYYAIERDRIVFASEIKALFAAGVERTLQRELVPEYFRYRYVKGAKTLFRGIERMAPAHLLHISENGAIQQTSYWTPRERKISSRDDFIDAFEEELRQAVARRMRSDVTVGAVVSGGIDSAAVLALMRAESSAPLSVLNYEMPGKYSERRFVEGLARGLSCSLDVVSDEESIYQNLARDIRSLEEPIGDSIISPASHLYAACRTRMKVCLSGEGADEILGGYAHHRALGLLERGRVPRPFRVGLGALVARAPISWINAMNPYPAKLDTHATRRIGRALAASSFPASYRELSSLFDDKDLSAFLTEDLHEASDSKEEKRNLFTAAIDADRENWLPNYGLLRVDKLSMAHGLEVRVPYLSHTLVELLRSNLVGPIDHRDGSKRSLRKVAERVGVPKEIWLRKKQPFFVPMDSPASHVTRQLFPMLFCSERLGRHGLFSEGAIRKLLQEAPTNFLAAKKIQSLANFQVWLDEFFPN